LTVGRQQCGGSEPPGGSERLHRETADVFNTDIDDAVQQGRWLTLLQAGTALAWDEHGYCEVALDAGSLILGP
jgi:hypothetical protein